MKKFHILLFFACLFFVNGTAQDKAKDADIQKLLELLQTEKMIDGYMNNLFAMIKKQTSAETKSEQEKVMINAFFDYAIAEGKELSNKVIREEFVNIYGQHFTHQEIKDIIKFYQSPTGKKMVTETPLISSEYMEVMSKKYIPDFQYKLKVKMIELQEQAVEQE